MSERKVVRAGLVATGFDEDSSNFRTNSPTCTRESMCCFFLTAASNKWEIKSLDIKAAFLHGYKMERNVFLRPPGNNCPVNKVWKLPRCIHILNNALRAWYSRVNKEMINPLSAAGEKSRQREHAVGTKIRVASRES